MVSAWLLEFGAWLLFAYCILMFGYFYNLELTVGLEPTTGALRMRCSTN